MRPWRWWGSEERGRFAHHACVSPRALRRQTSYRPANASRGQTADLSKPDWLSYQRSSKWQGVVELEEPSPRPV
jgi:hypothetical protein